MAELVVLPVWEKGRGFNSTLSCVQENTYTKWILVTTLSSIRNYHDRVKQPFNKETKDKVHKNYFTLNVTSELLPTMLVLSTAARWQVGGGTFLYVLF